MKPCLVAGSYFSETWKENENSTEATVFRECDRPLMKLVLLFSFRCRNPPEHQPFGFPRHLCIEMTHQIIRGALLFPPFLSFHSLPCTYTIFTMT